MDSNPSPESILSTLTPVRLLALDNDTKSVALLCDSVPDSKNSKPPTQAVLILGRPSFPTQIESLGELVSHQATQTAGVVKLTHANDVYSKFSIDCCRLHTFLSSSPPSLSIPPSLLSTLSSLSTLPMQLIHPVTHRQILKYTTLPKVGVVEDIEGYKKITLPYVKAILGGGGEEGGEKEGSAANQWIYNILEGRSEHSNVVYRSEWGFEGLEKWKEKREEYVKEGAEGGVAKVGENGVLNPNGWLLVKDYKCPALEELTPDNFHFTTLVYNRRLRTIRDLTIEHLPILKDSISVSKKLIASLLSISPSQIRVHFHYLPTFFHLHVHFSPLSQTSSSSTCERAVLAHRILEELETKEAVLGGYFITMNIREKKQNQEEEQEETEEEKRQRELYEGFKARGYLD